MCPGHFGHGASNSSRGLFRHQEQKRAAVSVQPETETGTAQSAAAAAPEEGVYSFAAMEAKWPQVWEDLKVFTPADDGSRERRYVLDMFPYPSGDLHMGHAEAFAMGDVVARYLRQKASTSCTPSAGTPSGCRRKTPPSSGTPTPASGPTPTSTPRPRPSRGTPSPRTGRVACTPPILSTTAGRNGCSSVSTSVDWPTARTRRSTGARRT